MDYETLLKKAQQAVPHRAPGADRFETPTAVVEKAGRRTIITNIMDIARTLRREPDHLVKFLLKELATKGDIENQRLFIFGMFTTDQINRKIEFYVRTYVLCHECSKPDTKMIKEGRFLLMKCEACGARSTLQ